MADIRDSLSKEWHGIPVWVILVVIGSGIGLYIRHRNSKAQTPSVVSDPQSQAATSDNAGVYGGIDPNTGIPYSLESSGLVGSSDAPAGSSYYPNSSPDIAQEIGDVSSLMSELQTLPGFGAGGQVPAAPVVLGPGQSAIVNGQMFTAPGGSTTAPQTQSGTASATTTSMPQSHVPSSPAIIRSGIVNLNPLGLAAIESAVGYSPPKGPGVKIGPAGPVNTKASTQTQWEQAFANTHGGLNPTTYNKLYRAATKKKKR